MFHKARHRRPEWKHLFGEQGNNDATIEILNDHSNFVGKEERENIFTIEPKSLDPHKQPEKKNQIKIHNGKDESIDVLDKDSNFTTK